MHEAENYSGLWFDPRVLQPLSDGPTYGRGLMLFRNQKVLDLDIEPLDGHWLLLGTVQGSQREPYEVSIEMNLTAQGHLTAWDSLCECPVQHQCKHGVALMLKAAYQGLQLLRSDGQSFMARQAPTPQQIEASRQAALAHQQELARLEAETQLLRWLQALDVASGVHLPTGQGSAQVRYASQAPQRDELYLYLLTVPRSAAPVLQLDVMVSSQKQKGGWAKPKLIRYRPARGQPVFDAATETDHQVLQLMRAMPAGTRTRYAYSYDFTDSVNVEGQLGLMMLEQAASTGRLLLNAGQSSPDKVIQWGPPLPLHWEWHELTSTQASEPGWVLRAKLESSAQLCLNTPPLYLDTVQGLCGPVQAEGVPPGQLGVLLKAPPLKPSALKTHQVALLQRLGKIPAPPVLEQLHTLSGITPRACLHLSPVAPSARPVRGLIQAQLRFDYDGHRGWWAGQGGLVLVEASSGRCLLQRDAEAELDAITRLAEIGLRSVDQGLFVIPGADSQQIWLHWATQDFGSLREAGFELTLDDALNNWISYADTLDVKLAAQGGDDEQDGEGAATSPWFDLSLGMEINGVRHNILPWLPSLIAQASASGPDPANGAPEIPPFMFLPNADGTGFIRLPTEPLKPWLAALLELVGDRAHNFSGDSLKLSRFDALRASAALGEGAVWQGAQALRNLMRQLKGNAPLPEVPVPQSVQAILRPYQQQGLSWLQFLREHALSGILADDMGLGKTLQTLVHIQVEKDAGRLDRPALIIAPVSLMGNWRRETERFCPQLRCLVIHGKDRHEVAGSMAEFDVVIAPYSLLQRDRERWLQAKWHLVVLDEAQNIKNANTYAAQVVGELRTRHRLCLSGTPMENHLGEIWSLFHFLMPGFLGSQKRFTELFRHPIEKQGDPDRLTQLRARITPFMLRRTKALVAAELPPKVETVMRVELSGKQADLYETIRLGMEKTVREALNTKGLAKSQITILDALLKLRQVCCDPHLLKLAAAQKVKSSAKLEQLMELLPEMLAEGRRILLFSQFTSMLALIEAELMKRDISWVKLTGQSQNRDALIEQFTSGAVPLFLISLKAGGTGLNLPQADTVIHYDPWWNPAVENQATDRAHRIGQTQSVWVVKLVAQGTIEERILALQERKAALANSMYSGAVGRKQPLFTEGDLAELLKPLSV